MVLEILPGATVASWGYYCRAGFRLTRIKGRKSLKEMPFSSAGHLKVCHFFHVAVTQFDWTVRLFYNEILHNPLLGLVRCPIPRYCYAVCLSQSCSE